MGVWKMFALVGVIFLDASIICGMEKKAEGPVVEGRTIIATYYVKEGKPGLKNIINNMSDVMKNHRGDVSKIIIRRIDYKTKKEKVEKIMTKGKINTVYKFSVREKYRVYYIFEKGISDMNSMFLNCYDMIEIDFRHFIIDNVLNMKSMFAFCSSLKKVEFNVFCDSSVKDMSYMFSECASLESLDLCNFNTGNVTNMCGMFSGCAKLNSLDISSFKTLRVTNMSGMFDGCMALEYISFGNDFRTLNVKNMSYMFRNCGALVELDCNIFLTEQVNDMSFMFYNCKSLESLDFSKFNIKNVVNMSFMFYGCDNLSLYCSEDNLSNLPSQCVFEGMLQNCTDVALFFDNVDRNRLLEKINEMSRCGCF